MHLQCAVFLFPYLRRRRIQQMTHWAFCENLNPESVVIEDAEAHHLLHVLRLGAGSELTLFDGNGTAADAVVSSASRRDVTCRILTRITKPRDGQGTITVIAPPPKADRLKWMVEKLTEIGVDRLILLNSQRTIVTPSETRVDKLRANVIAACKQCRRPFLMELLPLKSFNSVVEDLAAQTTGDISYIAHPGLASKEDNPRTHDSSRSAGQNLSVLIGPEGGFTDDEIQIAVNAGHKPISWPGSILRIETAAIVFGSLLMSQHR